MCLWKDRRSRRYCPGKRWCPRRRPVLCRRGAVWRCGSNGICSCCPWRSTTMSSHLSRLIVSKALITRGVAVVAALLLGAAPLVASAQARPIMRIGAVIASSGPASFLGVPEKNAIELAAEKFKNDRSLPFDVEFIVYDDASDPTKSVNSARRLINEDNVHVVICCTTTPASMAILETSI